MDTLSPKLLDRIDAHWRAVTHLSAGQIFLFDNLLSPRRLTLADVKHMPLGHWGTTSVQDSTRAYLKRIIRKHDRDTIYVTSPGARIV